MAKRDRVITTCLVLFGIVSQISGANDKSGPTPNTIIVLEDNLGYGDIGCYGQQKVNPPNFDRLTTDGIQQFDKGIRTFELYNLKNDTIESNDISSEVPEIVKTIQSFMRESYTFSNDYDISKHIK